MDVREFLKAAAGEWEGTYRLWLRSTDAPDAQSSSRATMTAELGGRSALLRYDWRYEDDDHLGVALLSATEDGGLEMGWSDTFHAASGVMHHDATGSAATVLAHYGSADEPWGWRTEFEMPSGDQLVVRAFNLPPGRPGALATEASYRRR